MSARPPSEYKETVACLLVDAISRRIGHRVRVTPEGEPQIPERHRRRFKDRLVTIERVIKTTMSDGSATVVVELSSDAPAAWTIEPVRNVLVDHHGIEWTDSTARPVD